MSGPASQMTTCAGSDLATQPPLNVLANEALHQLGPVGIDEPSDRFLDDLVPTAEPTLIDQRVDLAIQPFRDSCFDGFHGYSPYPDGKRTPTCSITRRSAGDL